jgi:hypothetical protein
MLASRLLIDRPKKNDTRAFDSAVSALHTHWRNVFPYEEGSAGRRTLRSLEQDRVVK